MTHNLSKDELILKYQSSERLAQLLREEELKWFQRAKVKNIPDGDNNTRYFHMVANGRHSKHYIHNLEQDEGIIDGPALKQYITNFYKQRFGPAEHNHFTMDDTRIDDIPQITSDQNQGLTAPFSEEEVCVAIFQMEHNKAPGPDSFPAEFYQRF